jgi:hypothetical protein
VDPDPPGEEQARATAASDPDEGGDPACWAHLFDDGDLDQAGDDPSR